MASSRLLKKILADFTFGLYLLNEVLKHATNHTQTRWQQDFQEKFAFDSILMHFYIK